MNLDTSLNKPDSLQIAQGAFTFRNTLQNPLSETSLSILTRSNGVFSSLVPKQNTIGMYGMKY